MVAKMKKEDLKKYTYIQTWIKDRIEYLEEYKENVNKLTVTVMDVPSYNKSIKDKMAERITMLMDFADELTKNIKEQEFKKKEILNQLDKLEQPYQNILFKIYIQGKSLVQVSDELSYNYKYLSRIHMIALKKFEELANK